MTLFTWRRIALGAVVGTSVAFTALIGLECSSCAPSRSQHRYPSEKRSQGSDEALELVESSMMQIRCNSADGITTGTGIVFRTFSNGDAYLLTANHVMGYEKKCSVTVSSRSHTLKMESRYDAADIAIASTNISPVKVYSIPFRFDVREDLDIVSMGFRGNEKYYSFGHVVGIDHPKNNGSLVEMYRIHAYVRPGNSGGPVTDDYGRIIGVNISWEKGYTRIGAASAAKNLQPQLEMILAAPDRPSFPVLPLPAMSVVPDAGLVCAPAASSASQKKIPLSSIDGSVL